MPIAQCKFCCDAATLTKDPGGYRPERIDHNWLDGNDAIALRDRFPTEVVVEALVPKSQNLPGSPHLPGNFLWPASPTRRNNLAVARRRLRTASAVYRLVPDAQSAIQTMITANATKTISEKIRPMQPSEVIARYASRRRAEGTGWSFREPT